MTNPNNAVGTNAAYGGRTSVNAFNDSLALFSRGVMSGWECTPNTGLTVSLGGSGDVRDVAVAEDNIGDKVTINNISGSPVDVTLPAAPGANSRIDAIVAYVDNPPQGESTVADNPGACGIIPVSGIAASSPVPPSSSTIRSAITADGASGTTAYYVILAYVTVQAGTTDITTSNISAGESAAPALGFVTTALAENVTVTTTQSTILSLTVPYSGTWMMTLSGFAQNATVSGYYRPYIYVDSTRVLEQSLNADAGTRQNLGQTYVADMPAGTVVSLQMFSDSGTYLVRAGTRLSLLKVG